MRKMKPAEIKNFIKEFGCATLCMAEKDGSPYAIEYSYFPDNNDICGLVHSTGRASRVLTENNRVCLKICDSDRHCENFTAISCFGTASFERLSDKKKIAWAWDAMERQLGAQGKYDAHKQKYLEGKKTLPLLRIKVLEMTGVTSRPRRVNGVNGE